MVQLDVGSSLRLLPERTLDDAQTFTVDSEDSFELYD